MHPRIEEVLAHLDTHRAALEAVLAEIPPSQRTQRPAPERWSVAEVLEHLALVEGRITELLAHRIASARTDGLASESQTSAVLPTFDMERMLDRSYAVTASASTQPGSAADANAAWDALTESRTALREMVIGFDGLAIGEVSMPHPVLGQLDGWQWLAFIGGHEARHTDQIREIAASLAASQDAS